MTGSANPARCRSPPRSRTSAKGATRGEAPPVISASAASQVWRSSVKRRAAEQRRQQQPIRLQRADNLHQCAGQVVDEMQRGPEMARSSEALQREALLTAGCQLSEQPASARRRRTSMPATPRAAETRPWRAPMSPRSGNRPFSLSRSANFSDRVEDHAPAVALAAWRSHCCKSKSRTKSRLGSDARAGRSTTKRRMALLRRPSPS